MEETQHKVREGGRSIDIRPPRIPIFPSGVSVRPRLPPQRRPLSFEEVFLILIHGKYHFTQIKQAIFRRTILIGFSCKRIIRACGVSLNNFHTFRTLFPLRITRSCSGSDSTASAYVCYRCQTIQISGWTNGAGELRRAAFRARYLLVNGLKEFPLVLPDFGVVHLPHKFGVFVDEPRLPENICSRVFHLERAQHRQRLARLC